MTNQTVESFQDYFEQQTVFYIDSFELEKVMEKIYKVRIQMLESSNDTTHEYHVEKDSSEAEWEKETVEKAVKDKSAEQYKFGDILNDMCQKGHIQAGKYLIRVCW